MYYIYIYIYIKYVPVVLNGVRYPRTFDADTALAPPTLIFAVRPPLVGRFPGIHDAVFSSTLRIIDDMMSVYTLFGSFNLEHADGDISDAMRLTGTCLVPLVAGCHACAGTFSRFVQAQLPLDRNPGAEPPAPGPHRGKAGRTHPLFRAGTWLPYANPHSSADRRAIVVRHYHSGCERHECHFCRGKLRWQRQR